MCKYKYNHIKFSYHGKVKNSKKLSTPETNYLTFSSLYCTT